MTEHGFTRSDADHAVYHTDKLIVAIYIDDLIIAGKGLKGVNEIKHQLAQSFKMSDLGDIKVCLGIQIERDRKNRTLTISQPKYAQKILNRFKMADSKPIATPIEPGASTESEEPADKVQYQQAVGSLMYLMLGTRPDIAFAVGYLGRFSAAPNAAH